MSAASGSGVNTIVLAQCQLGEGLCWDAANQRLFFVDIHGQRLHSWHPREGIHHHWPTPERIGWILPTTQSDRYVVGLQSGFALMKPGQFDAPQWLARVFADEPHMRLNDAKTDASGVIWAGSLNNDAESRPDGRLFRFHPASGSLQVVDEGYCVCNGPAISPDGQLFLHTDSARRTIFAFTLRDGQLHDKRVWKIFTESEGYPDGMTFDAAGHVWVAHWGGSCISQFDAEGTLRQRVALPASHITNVCFGGPQLDRLFVTSARVGLSEAQLALEPLAGSLFEVQGHEARGLPTPLCTI